MHTEVNVRIREIATLMVGANEPDLTEWLEDLFCDSIAPMIALTETEFGSIEGVTEYAVSVVKQQLARNDLQFRNPVRPLFRTLEDVYGTVGNAPVQTLFVFRQVADDLEYGQFRSGRVIRALSMAEFDWTLLDLENLTDKVFIDVIRGLPMTAMYPSNVATMLDELELRMASWGLSIAPTTLE